MKSFLKIFLAVTLVGLMAAPTYAVVQNFGPRISESMPSPQGNFLFGEMINKPVTNTASQQLGRVNSLLFDESGRVSYLIIAPAPGIKTYGQMVAVPWNAANPSLQNGQVLVSLSRQQLVNAPGISSNNIAQLQNPQMQRQVNAYFGTTGAPSGVQPDMEIQEYYEERPEMGPGTEGFYDSGQMYRYRRSRPGAYGGQCGPGAYLAPVPPARAPQGFEPMGRMHNVRVDNLIGQPVINRNGEQLGMLDDLLVSQNGQARFIIVIPRGQSQELAMIPWNAAQPTVETDRLIVSMSRDQFNNAQRFARSRFGRQATQPNAFGYYGEGAGTFPIRVNAVIGEQLYNFQGQELGVIRDLTTNRAGYLKFAILSPAENLQMGDELVAIPWPLIQTNPQRDRLMADISVQELQNAPTFTTENWRQRFTDPQFDRQVFNYFSVEPGARVSRRAPFMQSGLMRASHLLGETAITPSGLVLGSVRDMIISDSGQVNYLLISQQVAPGQIVAVPWDAASPTMQQNQLAINVSQGEFDNAPSFAMSNWRYLNSARFENRINSYFGTEQRRQLPGANQEQGWELEEIEIY